MSRSITAAFAFLLLATAPCASLRAQNLNKTVEGIERHYNSLSALQMEFEQLMEYGGNQRIPESGTLYLLRPGKMRWDYTEPEGKLAVSDGKIFRMYNPYTNQVRQVELEAMADLRAPLSFLLGRMRIRRMFRNLRLEQTGEGPVLIGEGREGRDFYERVEFAFDADDFVISEVRIVGRDESINVYKFSGESKNPSLAASLFEFEAPEGAEVVPLTGDFGSVPLETE